jgi:hypothetical protein
MYDANDPLHAAIIAAFHEHECYRLAALACRVTERTVIHVLHFAGVRVVNPSIRDRKIILYYTLGDTPADIALALGLSSTKVYDTLKLHRVALRPMRGKRMGHVTAEDVARAQMYKDGHFVTHIAKERGTTCAAVYHTLKKMGIPLMTRSARQ